uniref:Cytochrome b n=1 Tax=Ancoracysta twista TaxID=2044563 RepID=A0A2H4R8H2_9EUKA|nr:cytochrome b [Ancoracysta twista]ATY40943.1 cytochrome b [Ancoracysta twista]
MRVLKLPLANILNQHLVDYPTPINISYFWNFGVLAGFCLIIQILTGIFLAMHYTPHVDLAFASVEHIMRDVNYGWLIRYTHANGASMFFIVIYLHVFRGLYYGSYDRPRALVWIFGVVIMLLTMGTAFLGYVLPWGQMSFWGATVITNFATAIPYVGYDIVYWLWGGFSVDNATLNRFFSLHYLLPFVIAALSLAHLLVLHETGVGSGNPLGIQDGAEKVPFYPYFYTKDLFGFLAFATFFAFMVFFYPNLLGHSDNYIPANPMVTPAHIVPEWYFLPFYAILRSIPDKLLGVLAMVGSIAMLALLPILNTSPIRSSLFRPIYKKFYWLFIGNFFILGWLGGKPIETPFVEIGQVATLFYFVFLLVLVPAIGYLEKAAFMHWKEEQNNFLNK